MLAGLSIVRFPSAASALACYVSHVVGAPLARGRRAFRAGVVRRASRCRIRRFMDAGRSDQFEIEYEADYLLDRYGARAFGIARRYRNLAWARDDMEAARLWSAVRRHMVKLVCDGASCAWEPDLAFIEARTEPATALFHARPHPGAPARTRPADRATRPAVIRRLRPRLV